MKWKYNLYSLYFVDRDHSNKFCFPEDISVHTFEFASEATNEMVEGRYDKYLAHEPNSAREKILNFTLIDFADFI